LRKKKNEVEKIKLKLSQKFGRIPTEEEIAKEMAMTIEEFRKKTLDFNLSGPVSFDTRPQNRENWPEHLDVEDKKFSVNPDKALEQKNLTLILDKVLKKLTPRERKLLGLYFNEEMTLVEIGKMLGDGETGGVNESRTSQIKTKALKKLRNALEEEGIFSVKDFGLSVGKSSKRMDWYNRNTKSASAGQD
jgi:RNA polymerase sigma factor for flagellar operon FliA